MQRTLDLAFYPLRIEHAEFSGWQGYNLACYRAAALA